MQTDTQENVSSEESKQHFARNTWSNAVFFFFNAITSFLMVPYQIVHLGMANYGMVGLAFSFVSYIQVMSVALTSTMGRFVVFHCAKNETDQARSYISTQLVTNTWLSTLLFPIVVAISYFAPHFVNYPPGEATNTSILFFLVIVSFIVSLFSSMFGITIYVKQRFDLRNGMTILQQIMRYSTWIVMFNVFVPAIWHIGLGVFLEALTSLVCCLIIFRMLTPDLAPKRRYYDKNKFWEMTRFGGWVTVDQIGTMLFMGVDPFVINRMLGPESVGRYAAIVGIAMQLRGAGVLMSEMIAPFAIASYAREDLVNLMRNSARAVRLISTGLALPIGVICGLAIPFVTRWLGPQYASLSILIWILFAHQVINTGVQPLFSVTGAAMKVAVPGIATIVCGAIKLTIAILLVKYTSLGIVGVAISSLIGFTLKNVIFAPFYAARVLKQPSWKLYTALIPSTILFTAVALTGLWLSRIYNLVSYPRLFGVGAVLVGLYSIAAFYFVISNEDRNLVRRLCPWTKKRALG